MKGDLKRNGAMRADPDFLVGYIRRVITSGAPLGMGLIPLPGARP